MSGAYVHQPDRSFREDVVYLGFYANGAIQPLVARIRARYPSVAFTDQEAARRRAIGETEVADLIEHFDRQGSSDRRGAYGVMLLSAPDSPDTVALEQPIVNDTRTVLGSGLGLDARAALHEHRAPAQRGTPDKRTVKAYRQSTTKPKSYRRPQA